MAVQHDARAQTDARPTTENQNTAQREPLLSRVREELSFGSISLPRSGSRHTETSHGISNLIARSGLRLPGLGLQQTALTTEQPKLERLSLQAAKVYGMERVSNAPAGPAPAPAQDDFAARISDGLKYAAKGVSEALFDAGRSIGKGLQDIGGGIGRIFRGDLKGGAAKLGEGLRHSIVEAPLNAAINIAMHGLTAAETFAGKLQPERTLTAQEIEAGRKVFGDQVDYSRVRIKEAPELIRKIGMTDAIEWKNTIYAKPGQLPERTLIHELAHVWQFQKGLTNQTAWEAVSLQLDAIAKTGDRKSCCVYSDRLASGTKFKDLDCEQQAQLITHGFQGGYFADPANTSFLVKSGEKSPQFVRPMSAAYKMLTAQGYVDRTDALRSTGLELRV